MYQGQHKQSECIKCRLHSMIKSLHATTPLVSSEITSNRSVALAVGTGCHAKIRHSTVSAKIKRPNERWLHHTVNVINSRPVWVQMIHRPMIMAWHQWTSTQVAEWLTSVGFAPYAEVFRTNDIAGDILPELTNEVLRDDLGIAAFGHRARILNAVKALRNGTLLPDKTPSPPPPVTNAKSSLDLVVLHAAPLVIRDGKRLYTMEKLDLEAERRAITNSLLDDIRDKAIHVRFEVATADILRRVMTASTCRVVHFSGHGLGTKPALCFEDGLGCTHLVTPEILRDLTFNGSTGASQTQLVFVNSCHSENVAKVFLEAGIPHVVAVHSDSLVVDASATMFAKHFYLSLFSGHTVQAAFNVARAFVRTLPSPKRGVCCCAHLHEPDCKWRQAGSRHSHHLPDQCCCKGSILPFPHDESSKFLLLGGDGSQHAHEVVLFGNIPPGKLTDHTMQSMAILPSLHGQFIGRGLETFWLVKSLRDNAVTTCIGAPGIGKSSLVISVGHFAHSRRMFPDGVFYVDLEGQKLSAVRYAIAQCMGIAAAETDEEVFAEIGSRQCLLILDKAEELLDEDELKAQQFFSRIVALAPRLRLLLGSRRIPHIPNVTCYSLSLQQLPTRLAVDLLCLMAPSCPPAAAERLAKLCGCLPLAIRIVGRALANARSTVTPDQMIEHLEGDESRLETMKELNQVGHRECVDRCIRSSYSHLDEPLQLAFMALGLFRGSFDAAAVEAVLDTVTGSKTLTARSIVHSSASSSSSVSSHATRGLNALTGPGIEDDLESTTGLGTKLAEADGFTHENDGVFTREAYNLLDFESPEEALARTVAVASTANALKLLYQWSLVEYDGGRKRYRMHNLIQLFAEEEATRLGESPSLEGENIATVAALGLGKEIVLTWRRRFIRHFCVIVANASHSYRYNGDLILFDSERANIESAMRIGRLLTLQSIDRMRDLRRQAEDERLEKEMEAPGFSAGEQSTETSKRKASTSHELFDKSALVDVLIYCNLVTRSRFIFRTRIEPKRRVQILSSCLQMARETRSLYCTCGCSENDPANLLWDIDDVKHDRPLGMLDELPSFEEPLVPRECQLDCSCPGIKELIGLEVLLLIDLGYASCDSGDWIAGEYYYLEVLRLQRDILGWGENAQVAEVLNQFGICLSSGWGVMAYNIWLLRHAERMLLGGLKVRGRVLGENHPDYATSLNNVANFYKNSNPNRKEGTPRRHYGNGKYQRRNEGPDESSETSSTTGTETWSTASSIVDDDRSDSTSDLQDVEALYRRSLRIRETTLGENHPHVAQSLNNLGLVLLSKIQPVNMKDPKNAAVLNEIDELYARALQIRRTVLGNSSFETAATLNNIGNLRRLTGNWKSAEEHIREALRVINRFDSEHGPRAARMYMNLARLQKEQKRYDEAIKSYELARDIRQKWFPDSRDVGYCIEQIGKCMILNGAEEEGKAYELEGRRMKKLGIAAIPDSSSNRSPRNNTDTTSSPFTMMRLRILDIIPQEVILSRQFNFPGKLLGQRGIHMKRIDAITCANVRYHGPWPNMVHKSSSPEEDEKLAEWAVIQITAATDLAMQRAKDHCIALLHEVAAQYEEFIAQRSSETDDMSTST